MRRIPEGSSTGASGGSEQPPRALGTRKQRGGSAAGRFAAAPGCTLAARPCLGCQALPGQHLDTSPSSSAGGAPGFAGAGLVGLRGRAVTAPLLSSLPDGHQLKQRAAGAGKDSALAPRSPAALRLRLLIPRMGFVLLLRSGIGFKLL